MRDEDPIEELRRIRVAYLERFNYDLHAIARDLQERKPLSGRTLVSFPPKPAVCAANGPHRVEGSGD